jgi:hypothetical protein
MNIPENDYTVTTIYFDGQFWCALIERNVDGKAFVGRYVFGEEPTNPRLLHWMTDEFTDIKFLPSDSDVKKIRFKKLAKRQGERTGIPKSLQAFSKAQQVFFAERKSEKKKECRIAKQEKWELKHQRKKERR